MLQEKNSYIVELLIQSTINGNLVWSEISTNDNRRSYYRNMHSIGEDGTKYELEVKYNLIGDNFKLEQTPSLWVRNTNLPNGMYLIGTNNTKEGLLLSLRNLVKDMFCQDLNPTSQLIEDTLDIIAKGISTTEYRENKLNKIIDDANTK